jgi:ribosomal protein L27
MPVGFPTKADYATGDVLTAANMNDLAGTLNTVPSTIGAYAAGKNKIINGDFSVWQRGTSFTPASGSNVYTADRFLATRDGTGTVTVSRQAFTAGAAPVAGYEGQFFLRFAQTVAGTGSTYSQVNQRIEDVRTFAGQTISVSFWAKAAATQDLFVGIAQNFGSGGSSTVFSAGQANALTTSWQRFSKTFVVPSISGKTVGTSSFLEITLSYPLNVTQTVDIWGVQVEAGSIATPFQTATGTIQGELAACQRYYTRFSVDSTFDFMASGLFASATAGRVIFPLPVQMRVTPSTLDTGGAFALSNGVLSLTATSPTIGTATPNAATIYWTTAGATASQPCLLISDNNASTYVGLSSEL